MLKTEIKIETCSHFTAFLYYPLRIINIPLSICMVGIRHDGDYCIVIPTLYSVMSCW